MNPTETNTVLLTRAEGIADLCFNRPSALNALDLDSAAAFLRACEAICADPDIRAVIVRGAGNAFGAGGDLAALRHGAGAAALGMIEPMHKAIQMLAALDAPVIASVHGVVAGGSLSLSMACDLAIAAEGTRFTLAYANVGASCDVGGSWNLPRLVGLRNAMQIALLSEPFDATEALRLGLVNRVVPAERLREETLTLARRLAAGPTRAYGRMKRLMRQSFESTLAAQLEAEQSAFLASTQTSDFQEAVEAFLAKRPAKFKGC